MENPSDSSVSPSSLLCQESETRLDEDLDDDDEYIQVLLKRETGAVSVRNSVCLVLQDWAKNARLDAVDFILNTTALLGFRFQTAYLSLSYFDGFLSERIIDSEKSWAVQLLSVACLSLAAKLEECPVPILSELQGGEYNFNSKIIQRMELLVLNTLQWKLASVTPFAYLPHFINKFCNQSSPGGIISRIREHILAVVREVNLMNHRPSAIASAAVLVALDQRLTRKAMELKINAIPASRFLDTEDVFTCYNIMQRLEFDKIMLPKFLLSPDLSPGTDVLQDHSVASSVRSKRKRLTFNDSDQNHCLSEKKNHNSSID
ncbi:hypothetical protein Nepgr_019818 [Nepenthes gracilis]|uniref:Cyclin-like domain-containing protein n=1 Tax=Nepenthes gracilis TaxID=150966 RepID=A0AAD3SVW4_NEPGR|nr:hypothetical protein Nepgr_019818 [Nepenthes gracilis]